MIEFLNTHYQPLLLILISIICFAAGSLKKQQKNYLLKSGIKTTGVVVDHEIRRSHPSRVPIYYPIIEFEDNENKLRQLKCDFGYSFKLFKQKQQVEIYYDSTDIRKFIINDRKAKPFEYIFPLIGSILFLTGIYLFIR
ncbi:DUF3592 domain-containing protein [Mucilaginibacter sp. JRF]|uniref:DUF3592 domain-containing protein n=1 Tax=Mucilaginibacter sp. JRF TaxID=2780088 RepID=UPI00187FCAB0|nr:DUF3592 domain-containing protein [Mucilaginibacter sp. JRF]MBE9585788.1 DUF3592 domain-containing protein [Mucilaginibacter sp. JRF]